MSKTESKPPPSPRRGRTYKYYDLVMAAFVTDLLCSNMIGPGKSVSIDALGFPIVFGAGNLFFPISYILGDVLTEVYGYAKARKVIWAGFGALAFSSLMSTVVIALPPNAAEPFNLKMQPALEVVFGNSVRIVAASALAFWVGDFANSYVLAKMKIWTKGRMLWTRTVGSTVVAEGIDSVIFYPIAFAGIWTAGTVTRVILFNWLFKILVEVVMTPVTYAVVGWLKRAEREDYFDTDTKFTPFSLND
ncbi:MAG TPA: queuosine precursor transporter [Byssovorax sp.]